MPLVRRTRATFRRAEFGFFGVCVRTLVQTPRFCGLPSPRTIRFFRALKWKRRAGALVFLMTFFRPSRTSWFIVGTTSPLLPYICFSRPKKKPKALPTGTILERDPAGLGPQGAVPSAKSSDRKLAHGPQPGHQRERIAAGAIDVNTKSYLRAGV